MSLGTITKYNYIPITWLKYKTLITPNVSEYIQQQEFSFTADGNAKQYSRFGRQFGNFV